MAPIGQLTQTTARLDALARARHSDSEAMPLLPFRQPLSLLQAARGHLPLAALGGHGKTRPQQTAA